MLAHDDIRTLTADVLKANNAWPTVIVGSPPCQDISCANTKGRGVDGERSGLFFEAIRLVGEIRPAWCCFENSSSLRTRGSDRVLNALEALGYACWPLVVGAVHAAAPHRRKRVWIVAADASGRTRPPRASRIEADGTAAKAWGGPFVDPAGDAAIFGWDEAGVTRPAPDQEPERAPRRPNRTASNANGAGLALWEGERGDTCAELPPALRAVAEGSAWNGGANGLARSLRVADGLSTRMARQCIGAYGDAVVPQITEAIGRVMMRLVPTDGTVLDLFAGAAGGWSFGLHRAGYQTIAFCEIDPWRRAVFAEGYVRARK